MSFAASVGEAVLGQFISYAKLAVESNSNDAAAYEHVLEGLQAAGAAGPLVVVQLFSWRTEQLSELKGRNDALAQRKRLTAEALFLEATGRLVGAAPAVLTAQQAADLEAVAFDWLLGADSYLSYPDPYKCKDRVVLAASRMLGALSPLRLGAIASRWVAELSKLMRADSNSPARQQLYDLCHGLRFVRLCGSTPAQLEASAEFLRLAHPLTHVAPDKKSRVQQAICDMLAGVLQPLADEGDPDEFGAGCDAELRKKFAAQVTVLRGDLQKWASKQSKQVMSGFPVVAALMCCEHHDQLVTNIDGFIDQLHKLLRDRRAASMAILCLCRVVGCFIRRMSPKSDAGRMAKWLTRGVAPVVQAMVRGNLPSAEQQELVRLLCATVAHTLPEFALTGMVLELLQVDLQAGTNWEAPMSGLLALLNILAGVPGRLQGQPLTVEVAATAAAMERVAVGVWVPPTEAIRQLLDLVKQGFNPLQGYGVGALMPRVCSALGRLITACHTLYGFTRLTSMVKTSDAAARERLGALPVFVMALQCVPFIMPEHWASGAICEDLPGYTVHAEQSMRQVSNTVLRRCMRCLPALRDKLVGAFAGFVVRIGEDYPEVVKDSLALLLSLLREWVALAVSEWPAPQPGEASQPLASFDSLNRVEGAALVLLCSTDVEVRKLGVELVRTARELHRTLASPPQPSSKRSTMHHADGTGGAPAARRSSLQSGGGGGRRATQVHGGAYGAALPESLPVTPAGPRPAYVADIIDRTGGTIVARCYWDFGRWSDLWRVWRPLPAAGATFEECLQRTRTQEDHVRWARLLCELMREVWERSEKSAWPAHLELIAKLQALLSLDSNGRQVLPADTKADLSRAYCLALAAAPLLDASRLGERSLTTREMARLLVASIRSGAEAQQATAVLALGNCNPACHALVLSEGALLADDYLDRQLARSISMPSVPGMGRKAVRKDDVRLAHAHLTRMIANNLPPGNLPDNVMVRDKLIEFVRDTARHITSTADVSPEVQQLRYCLCAVARQCGVQLGEALPQAFPAQTRRALYDMFSLYCEEAQQPGQFRSDMRRIITQAKARIKDEGTSRMIESDLVDSSEVLEHAAYTGMAAMLVGRVFSEDVRNPQGRVFAWVDRMLSAQPTTARLEDWGAPKDAVARSALTNLLQGNSDLASVFVDSSYSPNQQVAAGYFQVLTEVYATRSLPLSEPVVVGLVLHKVVDPRREVRDAARGLLAQLARREWGREARYSEQQEAGPTAPSAAQHPAAGADGTVVVGSLANSYATYQLRLSARLAKEHHELSDSVAIEVLSRQLANRGAPDALLSLCPWLELLTLPTQWEGQWAEALLNCLYDITAQQAERPAYERLWATLAANRLNMVPALNFLIGRGLREDAAGGGAAVAATGKEAVLYLSRVAAKQTIGHLVHEVALLIDQPEVVDEGGSPYAVSSPDGTPRILEYHHKRSKSSMLHPQLPALHRVSAGGASAAPGSDAGGSRPGTPGSAAGSAFGKQVSFGARRGGGGLTDLLFKSSHSHSVWSEGGGGGASDAGYGGAAAAGGGSGALLSGGGSGSGLSIAEGSRQSSMSRRHGGGGADSGVFRLPLRRPEMALSLLSEVAYEHDEEFRPHLPQLLHICLLCADSPNPVVRRDSQQLLVYLLYSLSLKHLEAAQSTGAPAPECAEVAEVVSQLQSRLGQRLWPREQPSLAVPLVPSAGAVAVFVQTVAACFVYDPDLRDQWCAEALRWTCGARARHAASRSHQSFCALRPVLGAQSASAMLAALHKCLAPGAQRGGSDTSPLDTAVEVLCSLRALLAGLLAEPPKALLYPQLLLACVALLNSSVVRVVELAMHLMLQLLAAVDLNDPVVHATMLAMLPLPEEDAAEAAEAAAADAAAGRGGNGGGGEGGAGADGSVPLEQALWPVGQGLLGGQPGAGGEAEAEEEEEQWLGPWLALPQLVVKALFQPETELLALEVLGAIAEQVARSDGASGGAGVGGQAAAAAEGSGSAGADLFSCLALADGLLLPGADGGGGAALPIEAVLGDLRAGLAISLGAALPWLVVHLSEVGPEGVIEDYLDSTARACAALGWHDLCAALAALAGMAGAAEAPQQWLPPLCTALAAALFPTHGRLVLQRLLEAVERGAERYQAAAIAAMRALFEAPGLDLGPSGWPASDPRFTQALSAHLSGPLSGEVLAAFKAMLRFQGGPTDAASEGEASGEEEASDATAAEAAAAGDEEPPPLEWRRCMDDLGGSNRLCSEALGRVIRACPGSTHLLWGSDGGHHASQDSFLPFLAKLPFQQPNDCDCCPCAVGALFSQAGG
ncbi:furry homolog-like [Micractinium conductrix]|uniref:Furry homolog-like n=1 Tax=Micractinium conductrix TaxID=554055 RepID=A0A2P6V1H6_9CHLO|nr:furry homolog-like [Micractinium conductrix]|eukprot:PSC67904.1 furry homolog-like [Micractinium conductrix]